MSEKRSIESGKTFFWLLVLYLSASNEFIAMKKILAMKIHRNEKGKFIALMLLTIFQRVLAFFEENFNQKSKFLTKLMYKTK